MAIFEPLSMPEPGDRDRGERDDRNRVAGDDVRHQRASRAARKRASTSAASDRRPSSRCDEAPERLLEGEPAGRPQRLPLLPEAGRDRARLREQEALDVEDRRSRAPRATRTATRITSAGIQSRSPRPTPRASVRPGARDDDGAQCMLSPAGSGSPAGSCSHSTAAEQLAAARSPARRSAAPRACRRCAAAAGRSRRSPRSGRAAGDITTTRVERKTASVIEWVTKTTVEPLGLPDPQQLQVEPLARHLVERSERLVHQQERRIERERPGDRDPLPHAARELPRVVVLEAGELDEVDHLRDALGAAVGGSSRRARAGARCSSRPCASRTARRPGRRSRSRGRAAPGAPVLPFDA